MEGIINPVYNQNDVEETTTNSQNDEKESNLEEPINVKETLFNVKFTKFLFNRNHLKEQEAIQL